MPAYLLTWDPRRWPKTEEEWQEDIARLEKLGPEEFARVKKPSWSMGTNFRQIKPDDRLFLYRQGSEPRGIFASGHVASEPFEASHWDGEEGQTAWYVAVQWDTLLNPYDAESILLHGELELISTEQRWSPRSSGEKIKEEAATRLEAEWQRFSRASLPLEALPETAVDAETFREGSMRQTWGTRYERDPKARKLCIETHGISCAVCEFNFEDVYGKVGKGYIHVHHLRPISEIRGEHRVNPVEDMRPICPNCHVMVHQKNPPYTIEELKSNLKRTRKGLLGLFY